MERKSSRLQQKIQPASMKKRRANRKIEVTISDSESERTHSLQETSPPAKRSRTEDEEVSQQEKSQEASPTETQGGVQGDDQRDDQGGISKGKEKIGGEKKKEKEGKEDAAEIQKKDQASKTSGKKVRVKHSAAAVKKKGYQGKNFLPAEWFISSEVRKVWMEGYASSRVAFCSFVCEELMNKLDIDYMRKLRDSSIGKMLNPCAKAYPRLTRLFFVNLVQEDSEKYVLTSKVAGISMRLDHKVFAKVLGIPRKFKVEEHPDRKECLEKARSMFFIEGTSFGPKQLTHSVLNCEAKILFTIIMRCVLPREHSRELVTDRVLVLMYLISQGFEIDLPSLIMEHMIYSATRTRNHPLPYANLLPLFFSHFEIPMKGEEKITTGFGLVDEVSLQRIGVVQTGKGSWKFYSELSEAEKKEKDFVKPKGGAGVKVQSSVDYSQVYDKLEDLEDGMEDLRQSQFDLSREFVMFKALVGVLNEKMDLIFECLNPEKVPSKSSSDTSVSLEEILGDFLKKKKKGTPVVLTTKDLFEDSGDSDEVVTEKEKAAKKKTKSVEEVLAEEKAGMEAEEDDDQTAEEAGTSKGTDGGNAKGKKSKKN